MALGIQIEKPTIEIFYSKYHMRMMLKEEVIS